MDIIAGRFRIERWLGEGSLGDLYQVEQLGTTARNTVRVLPHGAAGSQPPGTLVEANATRVRHPNLAPVYEVGRTPDGQIYVVMEYASGTLLAEVAARGAVPLRWSIEIARQMVAGMRAAHEAGAVHGTLTPESIVIGSTPDDTLTIRILDLGLSALFHWQGCPPDARYASPEVLAGARADERSDVFSLAAITHHLLTGTPLGGTPEEPNQIPAPLAQVLETALAPKPEDRFRTVAQLGGALERAWGGQARTEPAPMSEAVPSRHAATIAHAAPEIVTEEESAEPESAEPTPTTRGRRVLDYVGLGLAAAVLLFVWLHRPVRDAAVAVAPRPLPSAPAPKPTTSEKPQIGAGQTSGVKSAATAVSKPAQRKVAAPTLLPGQGYQAGLARDESAPAEAAAPAPVDAETPSETAPEAQPEVATAAPAPSPSSAAENPPAEAAAPAAEAGAAEAGMAEARAAAQTAVTSYASAIETNDVEAIRRVYPGLTESERSAWQEFFAAARDLKAHLTIRDVDVKGGVAEAKVSGTYEYANRSLNRIERRPVAFRATLTRGPGGWQLSEVR